MSFLDDKMNPAPLWQNGPTPGAFYSFPGSSNFQDPVKTSSMANHSSIAITTTTTVLGLVFDQGCVLAADTLGSYGSLARFRGISRLLNLNDNILLGCGGDYGDFQFLQEIIKQKLLDERCLDDGLKMQPRSLFAWITRVLYNKRCKLDPLWNNYVVAGIQDGEPYMGCVDKIGTAFEDSSIVTGLGAHIAGPLLRNLVSKGLPNEQAAINAIVKCLEILYYRDSRAFLRYQYGVITKYGIRISDFQDVKTDWTIAKFIPMI